MFHKHNKKNREVSRRHRGKGKAGLPQRVFKLLYPPVRIERTMGIIHHLFPFVKAFSENSFLKFFRIVRVFKAMPRVHFQKASNLFGLPVASR